ncbi:MAG TPA: CRISPR-associated endonuclease Cas2 [Eubacteriales bacterium]|nr:CRISPR-associated endonuclease Cas2 [Eubacteriales bacterium]
MLLVVTYDVNVTHPSGQKRIRQVAKLCEKYGMRVQNSVFEVLVDAAQLTLLKHELGKVIDPSLDSIRFYRLGNTYQNKIATMGKTASIQAGEPLIL